MTSEIRHRIANTDLDRSGQFKVYDDDNDAANDNSFKTQNLYCRCRIWLATNVAHTHRAFL